MRGKIKIVKKWFLDGPNQYHRKPVLRVLVDLGGLDHVKTDQIAGLNEKLIKYFPEIKDHSCAGSVRKKGGFTYRLKKGTLSGHVLEHLTLAILTRVGAKKERAYGATRRADKPHCFYIIISSRLPKTTFRAFRAALRIFHNLLQNKEPQIDENIFAVKRALYWEKIRPSTEAILNAAENMDIPYLSLGKRALFQLGYGKYQQRILSSRSTHTNAIATRIAKNKDLANALLKKAGIPVTEAKKTNNLIEAKKFAKKLGYPVVLKPSSSSHGIGVITNIKDEKELVKSWHHIKDEIKSRYLQIENHVFGEDYRFLIIDDKLVAAAHRIPAYVTGDGKSTIKKLVEIENKNPRRGEGHFNVLTKIKLNKNARDFLKKVGSKISSIPKKGKQVQLVPMANLSTGGEAIDVTDKIHPEIRDMVRLTTRTVGLDIAGVDIICKDIAKPLDKHNGAVIEINTAPGLRMHESPSKGKSRDTGKAIIKMLFPESISRIPIISVTGSNGKTTVVRMVAHILQQTGLNVGSTSTLGINLAGRLIIEGDKAGPESARTVLRDSNVDVAVFETARGGILRAGLGYDKASVGILTNITGDHIGQPGIKDLKTLIKVKATVIKNILPDGSIIINADDKNSIKLFNNLIENQKIKSKVILISLNKNNSFLKEHLKDRKEIIYYVNRGFLIKATPEKTENLLAVKAIPITVEGKAKFNIYNALCAYAACDFLKISKSDIIKGLKTFTNEDAGRLDIYDLSHNRKVLVTFAHDEIAYKQIIDFAKQFNSKRLVGVIKSPGNRPDEVIMQLGEISGLAFDKLYIKDPTPDKIRGRKQGEVADLLLKGALKRSKNKNKISVILNEDEAVKKALKESRPGDFVVIFAHNIKRILKIVQREQKKR